ncbi:MAG TPA: family 78 glycoside hydrolase catalytic domain, partial [Flavisolibacter sp.]|nr:family 78 glycoside hydrolase catalytic domain [Flavisolibacter sp.]
MNRLLLFLILIIHGTISHSQLTVHSLLCNTKQNPIGVGEVNPRFSWKLDSKKRNVYQTDYEIRWAKKASSKKYNWQTVNAHTDQSVNVQYKGQQLQSGNEYVWQVRVWDNTGEVSPWSETASWTMGLLQPADWKADWIEAAGLVDSIERPSPLFIKTFNLSRPVRKALVFVTSHGMYEASVNNKKLGDAYLTPGWTSYNKRLQYQVYDCTPSLKKGDNVINALLGSGWYRGYIGFEGNRNVYGTDIALLFQMDIEFNDGSHQIISSDSTWKWTLSGILGSEIYNGEVLDNRTPVAIEKYNSIKNWHPVKISNYNKDLLTATYNEPVRAHEEIHPMRVLQSPKGEHILDFGQNMVGWVRIKVKGHAGQRITLSHAEVLDKKGNLYTDNLRAAKEEDVYILSGEGEEVLQPHFTFQGFQYVKVEGWEGKLNPDQFTGVALYSDMRPTGSFSCSNALVNQLQHNIQWGQKGNFLDVPTDCPQRDERLGWTGDAQVFSRTAAFNYQVLPFFTKWLKDVSADQRKDGMVPFVVPNVLGQDAGGSSGWGDVAVIVPWNMYTCFGDTLLLQQQYASMKAWVDFMKSTSSKGLWTRGNIFGDWLFYRPFDDNDGRSAVTDKSLISEAFFIHSTDLLIKAAEVLNKTSDIDYYSKEAAQLRKNFMNEFVTPSGRLVSNTQTAYVLALEFNLLPVDLRQQAAERLVANVKEYNFHLTTGFLGTSYLCGVLTRAGYPDIAYRLL